MEKRSPRNAKIEKDRWEGGGDAIDKDTVMQGALSAEISVNRRRKRLRTREQMAKERRWEKMDRRMGK